MYYRRNTDENLRDLERRAASDPSLRVALSTARIRAGLCGTCGRQPSSIFDVCLICEPLELSWNSLEIAEHYAKELQDAGIPEEEALQNAFNAFWIYEDAQEHLHEELTRWMHAFNPNENPWCVTGSNLTWRRLSGHKIVVAYSGEELLAGILPNTDCTFTLIFNGSKIVMRNAHHDAPTGETYHITVAETCPNCGEGYCTEKEMLNCCPEED